MWREKAKEKEKHRSFGAVKKLLDDRRKNKNMHDYILHT